METKKMERKELLKEEPNLNKSIFVGIDAHSQQHVAAAANRFLDVLGKLTFDNNKKGIKSFLSWLKKIEHKSSNLKQTIIGIEGSGGYGKLLASMTIPHYSHTYEVNPLYTKKRRQFGTKRDKSDEKDAIVIAEVLTKKLKKLPRLTSNPDTDILFALKGLIKYYEDLVNRKTHLKNQIYFLMRQQGILKESRLYLGKQNLAKWQAKLTRLKSKTDICWEEKTRLMVVKQKLSQIKRLSLLIKEAHKELEFVFAKTKYQNLATMLGASTFLASKIVSESQGIERFKNINKFVAYAGLVPQEFSSGQSRKDKKVKTGNRRLNSAFYLIALSHLRWNKKSQEYFQKKVL